MSPERISSWTKVRRGLKRLTIDGFISSYKSISTSAVQFIISRTTGINSAIFVSMLTYNGRRVLKIELSASNLIAIATLIQMQAVKRRILSKRVLELVEIAIISQQIDSTKLKPKLFEKINQIIKSRKPM